MILFILRYIYEDMSIYIYICPNIPSYIFTFVYMDTFVGTSKQGMDIVYTLLRNIYVPI